MNHYKEYEHKAQYYETDRMGIIHHSNYIRWFEEARVDMMEQAGMPYRALEEAGIACAVVGVSCHYKTMVRFADTVTIKASLVKYNGAAMTLRYEIRDKESGELRCVGETKHCFLDDQMKLVSLKKANPFYNQLFLDLTNSEDCV